MYMVEMSSIVAAIWTGLAISKELLTYRVVVVEPEVVVDVDSV
jgi:hypothetical protein